MNGKQYNQKEELAFFLRFWVFFVYWTAAILVWEVASNIF